jgi:hypothetical protein
MSNGNPYMFEFLHRCRHPHLQVRLRSLDDLKKEYLDQVTKPIFCCTYCILGFAHSWNRKLE